MDVFITVLLVLFVVATAVGCIWAVIAFWEAVAAVPKILSELVKIRKLLDK